MTIESFARLAKIPFRHARRALGEVRSELRQLASPRKLAPFEKLQLGAGPNPLPGWANIDLEGSDICWDLTRPLPLAEGSVRLVYSEHFIEHVSRDDAQRILENCYRAMEPGGTIRISTPDLRKLAQDYLAGTIVEMAHGGWFPESPCRMVNEGMHLWGHQFLYDEEELTSALSTAGFRDVRRVAWRKSDLAELRDLETRPDFGDLIMEATR